MSLHYYQLNKIKNPQELDDIFNNPVNLKELYQQFNHIDNPIVYKKVLDNINLFEDKNLIIDRAISFSINNEDKDLFEKSIVLAKENNLNLKTESLILSFVDKELPEFINIIKENNEIDKDLANHYYSKTIRNPEKLFEMYEALNGKENINQETLISTTDKLFMRLDKEDFESIKEFIIKTDLDINNYVKNMEGVLSFEKTKYLDDNFKVNNDSWLQCINKNIDDFNLTEQFGKKFSHNVILNKVSIDDDDEDINVFVDEKPKQEIKNTTFEYLLEKDFSQKDIEFILNKSLESNRLDLVKHLLLTEKIVLNDNQKDILNNHFNEIKNNGDDRKKEHMNEHVKDINKLNLKNKIEFNLESP